MARYSRSGNVISHSVHMQRFGKPGGGECGNRSHLCNPALGGIGAMWVRSIAIGFNSWLLCEHRDQR
jgi:hypothetical protein